MTSRRSENEYKTLTGQWGVKSIEQFKCVTKSDGKMSYVFHQEAEIEIRLLIIPC